MKAAKKSLVSLVGKLKLNFGRLGSAGLMISKCLYFLWKSNVLVEMVNYVLRLVTLRFLTFSKNSNISIERNILLYLLETSF